MRSRSLLERVNARRDVRGPDECWPQTRGSVRISLGPTRAHGSTEMRRAVWLLEHGELPGWYRRIEVSCGNKTCLNPGHLFSQTEEERFWKLVDKTTHPNGCWLWTSHRLRGYGRFCVQGNKVVFAHRFSWRLAHGADPAHDLVVMHKCDNPTCVNPDHLQLGTHADNIHDAIAKGRFSRGERHGIAVRKAHAAKVAAKRELLSS